MCAKLPSRPYLLSVTSRAMLVSKYPNHLQGAQNERLDLLLGAQNSWMDLPLPSNQTDTRSDDSLRSQRVATTLITFGGPVLRCGVRQRFQPPPSVFLLPHGGPGSCNKLSGRSVAQR